MAWQREAGPALESLGRTWRRRAWMVYGCTALGSLVVGAIPLLDSLFFLVAMLTAQLGIIRPALRWLTGGRRVFAKITTRLLAAMSVCLTLVFDLLTAPLAVSRPLMMPLIATATMALWLEPSLWLLRRRLGQDERGEALRFSEWGLPLGVLGGLVGVVGAGSLAVVIALEAIQSAELPLMSDIAAFLLGA